MKPEFLLSLSLCLLISVLGLGCANKHIKEYEMRGVVLRLPDASSSQLVVLHEAIEDFENRSGEKSRMDVMMMGFAMGSLVNLDGIEMEDKLAMQVEVDWRRTPPMFVTLVEKLPKETELELDGYSVEPMVA